VELEKIIKMMGLTAKRYVYRLEDKEGKLGEKIAFKGVSATRRDSCTWQVELFTQVSKAILQGKSKDQVACIVYKYIIDVMRGRVPLKKLMIGSSIAESYASKSCQMAILKQRQEEAGRPIAGGSRIHYVVIQSEVVDPNTGNVTYVSPYAIGIRGGLRKDKVSNRLRMIEEITPETKIDNLYYVTQKAQKSIDQLFDAAFGDLVIQPLVHPLILKQEKTLKSLEGYLERTKGPS
jgi:DNA polymerase elongation subunit (family B)